MNETTEYEFERLIDKDKFTGRAETEARLNQEYIKRFDILERAFFDDSVNIIDYKILDLAAKSDEYTITAMEACDAIGDSLFLVHGIIHPIRCEEVAEEEILPRMRKLAEAKYLIEMEEENTPGIFKGFKLNLDFK